MLLRQSSLGTCLGTVGGQAAEGDTSDASATDDNPSKTRPWLGVMHPKLDRADD
jgi:hypothetical protein